MAFVQQLEGRRNTSGTTVDITVPVGGIDAGHALFLGMSSNSAVLPSVSTTDSAGNTWLVDGQIQVAASGSTHQLRTIVSEPLDAGDLITVELAAPLSRVPVCVLEFDDGIVAIDNGATGNNGGASSSFPTTDTFATSHAECLIVGTVGIISAARAFVPGTDYTAGTKVSTTNGSGDRAVAMQWQYVTAIDEFVSNGQFTPSGTLYGAVARAYALGDPSDPGGSGKGNVNVGGSWGQHPFKTHNGTAWQTRVAKRHNGTAWVPIT